MIILEAILGFFILDEVCKAIDGFSDDQAELYDEISRLKRELAVARRRV